MKDVWQQAYIKCCRCPRYDSLPVGWRLIEKPGQCCPTLDINVHIDGKGKSLILKKYIFFHVLRVPDRKFK